ncbi:MAG: phosphoribosylformylglycinamidine synthase, partial [Cyanobacteria bacterium HKST-UBA05]|nr:phosphoribosylformylglycinamidine synthase [Cyanobacteria bacterium HKST-UBA05]
DNVAKTVESNLTYLNPPPDTRIQVASGMVYLLEQRLDTPDQLAYLLFNPLIERARVVHIDPNIELSVDMNFIGMPAAAPWHAEPISLDLDDRGLEALSQSRCLALTLPEMQTIQAYFSRPDVTALRQQQGLPAEPTDIELEVLAQTWSEHCKHKIFSAKIRYTDMSDPDEVQEVEIDSLFKTFIVGATEAVKPDRPDLLSLFKDNAGVVQWDDQTAVCFKVETHNSPSALEPYGGALTGIVGVNRDILGTGLGAKPVFNTDVFCFANPDEPHANYSRMIPAPAILLGVRKGVEDGGNKSGIPTVNGALFFDPRFRAKPLVFCGTGGVMPLKVNGKPAYEKYTQPGDLIVMAGGRVGKDGIHGATFSSEALSETSPLSAVQIGDPLTQKRMGDFILEARDAGLLSGITDNGAGGLSSSVGEMAEQTGGATIDLDQVPLKYPGLKAYEAVISESQERMTLSITPKHQQALQRLADKHGVELSIIGYFHNQGTFDIKAGDALLASLDLDFLHKGLPQMTLKAYWEVEPLPTIRAEAPPDLGVVLLDLLKYPNICSREYLIRRYDHEVQGRSVVKPLMGPLQLGPCDAAVMKVHYDRPEGLVVSNGLCPNLSDWDTYHMATNAVDEAVRNAVAAGADPLSIVLLDNFCWPDPVFSPRNLDGEEKLAQLVRACVGLYDIATRYKAPFISGKDSMKNDYDDGQNRLSIPPTLLISAMGKLPDVAMAQTSHFKTPGDLIYLLGTTNFHPGGSQYYHYMGWSNRYVPQVNVLQAHANYKRLHQAIMAGKLNSCHDLSDGGCLVAIAESIIGSSYGAHIDLTAMATHSPELRWDDLIFSETPSRLLFSVAPEHRDWVETHFAEYPLIYMGQVTDAPELKLDWKKSQRMLTIGADRLRAAWSQPPAQCWGRVPSPVRTQATDFGSADFGQVAIEQEGELRG